MPRILVVDDETTLRTIVVLWLRKSGYDAVSAATGAEALHVVRASVVDGVILDLVLPDIRGQDVLAAIRAHRPTTAVVVITGHGTVESTVEVMKGGAFSCITKPFDNGFLLALLRRALDVSAVSSAETLPLRGKTAPPAIFIPAAERLCDIVMAAVACETDLRTCEHWARHVGISESTLREWCTAAGVKPRSALNFARFLRAISRAPAAGVAVADLVDIIDPRTRKGLFARAGLEPGRRATVHEYLQSQTFVGRHPLTELVARRCA